MTEDRNKMSVTIVGSGSANPRPGNNSSAQILKCYGGTYLIDCADGTTNRLIDMGIGIQKIDAIFITHAHGDHCLGLPCLLATMNLVHRTKPLKLFCCKDVWDMLEDLTDLMSGHRNYNLDVIYVDTEKNYQVYEDGFVKVSSFPLKHGMPCCGYKFTEIERLPHIKPDMIQKYNVPFHLIKGIKNGEDYIVPETGEVIKSSEFLEVRENDKPKSYAYVSDTEYFIELPKYIGECDLVYCEASFSVDDAELLSKYHHCSGYGAGLLAATSRSKKLIIGHISARYKSEEEIVDEAKEVFENTELAEVKKKFIV